MDYNHGTGHGVGAYLAVHEGPVGVGRDTSVLQVKVCQKSITPQVLILFYLLKNAGEYVLL